MLTGAGTFAREVRFVRRSGCEFFPRNEFLTVDVILQSKEKEFKSRNPQEIKNYVNNAKRSKVSLERRNRFARGA